MITVPVLSQRDPRWAWKYLGFSTATIGGYGCLLACLTMLSGKTDISQVNEILKSLGNYSGNNPNGAYLGNLVVWANIPKALPSLKFVGRFYSYDNQAVADYVYNKKIPVIVQVDAAPIGAPRTDHYVLYIGNKKLIDPWTGQIRPTSDFPIVKGYALYEVLNIYKEKNEKLKVAIDRLKSEFDSDLANPSSNQQQLYEGTIAKVRKIAETGTL